jgi:hypothetical protein
MNLDKRRSGSGLKATAETAGQIRAGKGSEQYDTDATASPPIFSKKTLSVDLSSCSPMRKMQSNRGFAGIVDNK